MTETADAERVRTDLADVARDGRRGFFVRACAFAAGAVLVVVPFTAGLVVFFDPLVRGKREARLARVASLEQVPADGMPHAFQVIATRVDKWNRYPKRPVAMVFVRRFADSDRIEAFNAECPHLGCLLDFNDAAREFKCPCHNSAFTINGVRIEPSPANRNMYAMPIDKAKLAEGEIWVELGVA